jgi:hypothetical protein
MHSAPRRGDDDDVRARNRPRVRLAAAGALSTDEVDALLDLLDEPASGWGPAMVTAWGRKA